MKGNWEEIFRDALFEKGSVDAAVASEAFGKGDRHRVFTGDDKMRGGGFCPFHQWARLKMNGTVRIGWWHAEFRSGH